MKQISALVFALCCLFNSLKGMNEPTKPPTPEKLRPPTTQKPTIPKIFLITTGGAQEELNHPIRTTPRSPRLEPSNNEAEELARGDKALYQALISNDKDTLPNFLTLVQSSLEFKSWWQDFTLTTHVVTDSLTADDHGKTFNLIETLIALDSQHPIQGSAIYRTSLIFNLLVPQAKKDFLWIDTASRYKNNDITQFINSQIIRRNNSSFSSWGSSEESLPPCDHVSGYETSVDESSDDPDAQKPPQAARQKSFYYMSIPRIILLSICGACVARLLYLWYQDKTTETEDIALASEDMHEQNNTHTTQ